MAGRGSEAGYQCNIVAQEVKVIDETSGKGAGSIHRQAQLQLFFQRQQNLRHAQP